MHILFPGRHHLLTDFQFKYLFQIIQTGRSKDLLGRPITMASIDSLIFAVTSANHSGTKRNPLPFHLRAMMAQEFGRELNIPTYVYGINDVGLLDDFASYTLKTIAHESDHKHTLSPRNTVVMCSTPVLKMYAEKGFAILPAELENEDTFSYSTQLPWDFVTKICDSKNWIEDRGILDGVHTSSFKTWNTYGLTEKVKSIFNDPIIGDDGDLTESRDYNTYVRQMDEIAELKFNETSAYIQSGNIGDIGCAVGSWIKLACDDTRLSESDFYGIEVARKLFDICNQRKHNGEFKNPSIFFAQKNAVTNLVFSPNSMNTIHTSSLTHEIESYGSRSDLLNFIKNRYAELKPGGIWINRDVIGPENGDNVVYLKLTKTDGSNENIFRDCVSEELSHHLNQLSTYARFIRFAYDFRKSEGQQIKFEQTTQTDVVALNYRDAADFLLTKDYTDNWISEMHETFCFWSFNDWKKALEDVGFRVRPESKAYQNPWIAENRWYGKAELFKDYNCEIKLNFPPTNMLIVAEKLI